MLQIDKLRNVREGHPDLLLIDGLGNGSDVIYLPESGNINNFFETQKFNTPMRVEHVTIPPRIIVGGKSIINNKYYNDIRQEKKNTLVFGKMVQKLKNPKKMRFFDASPVVRDVTNIANVKSIIQVHKEFLEKLNLVWQDFNNTQPDPQKENLPKSYKRWKVLLLDIDPNSHKTGFTEQLHYYLKMNKYQFPEVHSSICPDWIIYKIGNFYYPIGRKEFVREEPGPLPTPENSRLKKIKTTTAKSDLKDEMTISDSNKSKVEAFDKNNKGTSVLKIDKVVFMKALNLLAELKTGSNKEIKKLQKEQKEQKEQLLGFGKEVYPSKILEIGKDIADLQMDDSINKAEKIEKIRSIIIANPFLEELNGSDFYNKLKNFNLGLKHAEKLNEKDPEKELFAHEINKPQDQKDQELKEEIDKIKLSDKELKEIDEIRKQEKIINKKYHGTVFIEDMQERRHLGTRVYNPDNIIGLTEFSGYDKQDRELNENLDANIKDLIMSLEDDKTIGIKVHKITTKIKDTNTTRYKEYNVQISHASFGKTKKSKYTIRFRVPVPVEGKYLKIGGNNYIMVNQLISKPIQKITPELVRLYTHYNTTSVTLKSTKLNAQSDFDKIELEFLTKLQAIAGIKKTSMKVKSEKIESGTGDFLEGFGFTPEEVSKLSYQTIEIESKGDSE